MNGHPAVTTVTLTILPLLFWQNLSYLLFHPVFFPHRHGQRSKCADLLLRLAYDR